MCGISKKIWSAAIVVAFTATLVAVASVSAASVSDESDTLSTQEENLVANHTLLFTTPSGVSEDETVTVSFSSAFNTALITEDDVDMEDDGVDLTTAADCSGTEQASVTMAADILTITVCAGDGGAIAAASVVSIKIGTNATGSGTGTNQITNPTSGTYFVSVGGTFGDTGTIAIPILSDGSVGITGTVSGGGGGGSPTPPPLTDTTAPANVSGFIATASDAQNTLSWTNPTDSDFAGVKIVSCTNDFPSSHTDPDCSEIYNSSGSSFLHTGLTNGTTYYYGAFSYDTTGNYASGALASATPTATGGDEEEGEDEGEEEEEGEEETEEEETEEEETEEEIEEEGGEEEGEEEIEEGSEEEREEEEGEREGGGDSCGNDVCETTESSFVCPVDCLIIPPEEVVEEPIIEIPTTTVTEEELIPDSDVSFFGEDMFELPVSDEKEVETVVESGLLVKLSSEHIIKEVERVLLVVGSDTYILSLSNGAYSAGVTVPDAPTRYALSVIVEYRDGTSQVLSFALNLISGPVEEKITETTPIAEEITTTQAAIQMFQTISGVAETVVETIEEIRESPVVQTTTAVAAPVIAVTAVATTAVLATSFNLLPFLQMIFTSPLLLFGRRKRRSYGVVYHSFLKTPLDLVMVRLVKMPENKIFRAKVTDKNGRFFFLVQPGTYRLEVTKPGFNFPSAFLSQIKDDSIYLDVYHGEIIEVRDKDVIITPNVPLDPLDDKPKTPAQIKRTQLFRQIQKWISATGIVVAAAVCFVQTAVWSFALLGLQIAVYLLVLRLAAPRRPKSWGIVYDKETNKPLSNVIVRIFEPKYQKLLETAITDNKGRYAFILGPNEYSSTYEKGGYRPHETEVNFSNEQDLKELSKDIHLEPKKEN